MWLVKINKNLHTLALLILDKDHKSVTRNYHGFFTNQQKYAPLPKKKKCARNVSGISHQYSSEDLQKLCLIS